MTKRVASVVLVSTVLVLMISLSFGMSWLDVAELAGMAAGTAAATAALGAAALHLCRRRTIGVQMMFAALTPVVAVAAGAAAAAWAMFIAEGDVHVLLVVLVAAGAAGVVVSVELAWRVSAASRTLEAAARRMGQGDLDAQVPQPSPKEFAALARELQETSTRLSQARANERALDQSRRELVAWVSHDLRTPLAAIRALAEALEDGVADEPAMVERYLSLLRVETERLAGLVDDLFELSRIQAGTLRMEMERASLADLVSDAVAAASVSARCKNVVLEARLATPTPEFELSPPSVSRVLRNLLENAVRHTPSDGTVRVETGVDAGAAYIVVADECGGISEGDLGRLFEPAFRGEPARTPRADGGAGLGLTIARGLVEAHRGEVTVANTGQGCRFVVRLPLQRFTGRT